MKAGWHTAPCALSPTTYRPGEGSHPEKDYAQ